MYRILIITGPSGAGKSTITEHLLKKPLFKASVSYTTRGPRPGEVHGVHYFFTTKEDFEKKIRDEFFLEYTEFDGNYYGTPMDTLDEEIILIMDVEREGLMAVKERLPRSFCCLVTLERKILEKRLLDRMVNDSQYTEEHFHSRMEGFDSYEKLKDTFEFNFILDNSKSIEEVYLKTDKLADEVIEYYDIK